MSRVEAAAKAHYQSSPHSETWKDADPETRQWFLGRITKGLAAADAYDAANGVHRVTLDEATVERVAQALTAHAVITDGLAVGYGWCAECGEVDPDDDHEARAVLAAAVKEGQ